MSPCAYIPTTKRNACFSAKENRNIFLIEKKNYLKKENKKGEKRIIVKKRKKTIKKKGEMNSILAKNTDRKSDKFFTL